MFMLNLKLKDVKRLMRSKVYVLITEDETSMHGDLSNMDASEQLSTLKVVRKQVDEIIKEVKKSDKPSRKKK